MKQDIIIAIISMDEKALKRLFNSAKQYINTDCFQIKFIIFANNQKHKKPTIKNLDIEYLQHSNSKLLDIPSARTFLQQEVYKYCKNREFDPIIWMLDEDMIIDQRANIFLNKLSKIKHKYDVIIGSIDGDSPNASFSGINVQLRDLVFNLKYLDSLNDNDIFPNFGHHNSVLREKYPDYYYDLSSKHSKHLLTSFYITSNKTNEKVYEVRDRIFSNLNYILVGKNLFRSIIQERIKEPYNDTLLRGGNTFILNLDTLRVKNPIIKIGNLVTRRSDMLWALMNKQFLNKKIIKTDFTVIHDRNIDAEKELNVQKIIAENSGSIVFNALRIYYGNNTNFKTILSNQIKQKREAIERNFNLIDKNVKILKELKKPELKVFIEKLESFYNYQNRSVILKSIDAIINYGQSILEQFISHKPLILGQCILQTDIGDFVQYDIGNDDIKLVTKTPIEEIDKDKPIVRIHSSCTNSEIFGATDCDCADQLKESMKIISKIKNGILFYITQEGRGHGYGKKIAIVGNMQTKNLDTYEACEYLGIEKDVRNYTDIAKILKRLNIHSIEIASNNPKKIEDLKKQGIDISIRKSKLITIYRYENIEYLISKQQKGKHKNLVINENWLIEKYPYSKNKIEFYEKYDNYGCFSNFATDYHFALQGYSWKTSEHYYQANKFKRDSKIFNKIRNSKTPMQAKEIAYSNNIDYTEWGKVKLLFMHNALIEKFRQNLDIKQVLLDTKDKYIIERANDDCYWGSGVDNSGKNMLGRLLMLVRDEIKGG